MNTRSIEFYLILLLTNFVTPELIRYSLNSDEENVWNVKNSNSSIDISGNVPGGIYTDLQKAGILNENLLYRFNDLDYRWVGYDNWTYSLDFSVPDFALNKTVANLVFYGIDTVANIYLNDQIIAGVDNMFSRYVVNIKDIIKNDNRLEVRLKSPVLEGKSRYEENPTLPECVPSDYQGECHVNMIRKMQASFSWDWGPAFPSVGLWKSVELELYDSFVIRDANPIMQVVETNLTKYWILEIVVNLETTKETFEGDVAVEISELKKSLYSHTSENVRVSTKAGFQEVIVIEVIPYEDVKLWWPNGYGEQSLYTLNVTIMEDDEIDSKILEIGFRTVELVQEPISSSGPEGLSFYFKVNDVPIFAKGSNWIPMHVLPELGYNETQLDFLLRSAKDANMNMLRVWGGGVYESDAFYSIADKLGILIWQDMMFACAMYPVNDGFLESVRFEVYNQIQRLQYHPSIAVWSGNNENEAALRGNWYSTANEFDRYHEEYKTLYVNTIKTLVGEMDPLRPFVVSSPSNGIESESEDYIAKNPYDAAYGDVHYYNYVSDGWDSTTFPDTRFASEYGYQGMPSYFSLSSVSEPSDLHLGSEFCQKRQHHPVGYAELKLLISQRLPLPDDDQSEEYFKTFIYLSQISQAMSTKTESERYRRDRSKLTDNNLGFTMGALYWQLNDVWQAPTWSSIEFDGRWKMLHYFAKHFFNPTLISPEALADGTFNVYLVSDLLDAVTDTVSTIEIFKWDDFSPVYSENINQTLAPAASSKIFTANINDLFSRVNCGIESCFIRTQLKNSSGNIFSQNFHYPLSFNKFTLPTAEITVDNFTQFVDFQVTFVLRTNKIAPFIWLESPYAGTFSENGFTLVEPEISLSFNARGKAVKLDDFKSSLVVRALNFNENQKHEVVFANINSNQYHI